MHNQRLIQRAEAVLEAGERGSHGGPLQALAGGAGGQHGGRGRAVLGQACQLLVQRGTQHTLQGLLWRAALRSHGLGDLGLGAVGGVGGPALSREALQAAQQGKALRAGSCFNNDR